MSSLEGISAAFGAAVCLKLYLDLELHVALLERADREGVEDLVVLLVVGGTHIDDFPVDGCVSGLLSGSSSLRHSKEIWMLKAVWKSAWGFIIATLVMLMAAILVLINVYKFFESPPIRRKI